jgi:16S rRNA (adenine1518-N6/adenine1519-N6)-dimethyltransferase
VAAYHPKKRLGQNFLESEDVIRRVLELVDANAESTIIEIGPGRGALTLPLARTGARLLAVEFDRDLIGYLEKLTEKRTNVEIINADFLRYEPDVDSIPRFTLVGNIAYNITSPVLEWCTRYRNRITRTVLMLQKELAARVCSQPGSRDWSPLAVFTQLYFDVRYCFDVPPDSFSPEPKVSSAVVTLSAMERSIETDLPSMQKVVRAAFKHRRKLLMNNLVPDIIPSANVAGEIAAELSLSDTCRAEELSIDLFLKLTDSLVSRKIL